MFFFKKFYRTLGFQERISKASGQSPFPISAVIKDVPGDDDDDEDGEDDDDDDEEEETALEGKCHFKVQQLTETIIHFSRLHHSFGR